MVIKPSRFLLDTRKIKITERIQTDKIMHNTGFCQCFIVHYAANTVTIVQNNFTLDSVLR